MTNDECRMKEFFLLYFLKERAMRHPQFVNRQSSFVISSVPSFDTIEFEWEIGKYLTGEL